MGSKRKVDSEGNLEPWLHWHIRTFSSAKKAIRNASILAEEKLDDLKRSCAGHIARMGQGAKPIHLVKPLFLGRNQ